MMSRIGSRRLRIASLLAVSLLGAAGCARVPGHQGYLADASLIDTVQPGVDNKASVSRTLGRPTFIGQFDANDWYYVSRDTRQLAFALPRPTAQTLLKVRFDGAGNVAAVERAGLEKVARISPESDKTPTLGRNRSFFEELFGNIGAVGVPGAAGGGSTQDQP